MNGMNKDYKRIWFTYKVELVETFEGVCNEVVENEWKSEQHRDEIMQPLTSQAKSNYEFNLLKLTGQSLFNILVMTDRINNAPTVANLAPVNERAFELLEIDGYDYYPLPINKYISEMRTHEDKWNELKGTLEQLVQSAKPNTFIHEEIIKHTKEQLVIMNNIEEKFENEVQV